MRLLFFLLILLAAPALAQTPYDFRQDDDDRYQDQRFDNYIEADAKLSGKVESELSGIKYILGAIALAVISGFIGIIVSILKKKLSLPVILLIGTAYLLMTIPVQEAECQWCDPVSCTDDRYCASGCRCDLDYSFTCVPR